MSSLCYSKKTSFWVSSITSIGDTQTSWTAKCMSPAWWCGMFLWPKGSEFHPWFCTARWKLHLKCRMERTQRTQSSGCSFAIQAPSSFFHSVFLRILRQELGVGPPKVSSQYSVVFSSSEERFARQTPRWFWSGGWAPKWCTWRSGATECSWCTPTTGLFARSSRIGTKLEFRHLIT